MNVLLGALGNTRKRDPSELEEPEEASSLYRKEAKKLEIEVEQKRGNPKTEQGEQSRGCTEVVKMGA